MSEVVKDVPDFRSVCSVEDFCSCAFFLMRNDPERLARKTNAIVVYYDFDELDYVTVFPPSAEGFEKYSDAIMHLADTLLLLSRKLPPKAACEAAVFDTWFNYGFVPRHLVYIYSADLILIWINGGKRGKIRHRCAVVKGIAEARGAWYARLALLEACIKRAYFLLRYERLNGLRILIKNPFFIY